MKNFIPNEVDRKSLVWESLRDLKRNLASHYNSVNSEDAAIGRSDYFSKEHQDQEEGSFSQVNSNELVSASSKQQLSSEYRSTPSTIFPCSQQPQPPQQQLQQQQPQLFSQQQQIVLQRYSSTNSFTNEFHEFRVPKPHQAVRQYLEAPTIQPREHNSTAVANGQQTEATLKEIAAEEDASDMRKAPRSKISVQSRVDLKESKDEVMVDVASSLQQEITNLKSQIIKIRKENHQRSQEREVELQNQRKEEVEALNNQMADMKQYYEAEIASRDEDISTMSLLMQQNYSSTCEKCTAAESEISALKAQLLEQQGNTELTQAKEEIQRLLQTKVQNESQLTCLLTQERLQQEANAQLRELSDRTQLMVSRLLEVQQANQAQIDDFQQQLLQKDQQIKDINAEILLSKKQVKDKEELLNGLVRENRRAGEEKDRIHGMSLAHAEEQLQTERNKVALLQTELNSERSKIQLDGIQNTKSSPQQISYLTTTCGSNHRTPQSQLQPQNFEESSLNLAAAATTKPSSKQDQVLKNLLAKINNIIDSKDTNSNSDEIVVLDTTKQMMQLSPELKLHDTSANSSLNLHYNKKLRAMRGDSMTSLVSGVVRGRSTSEASTPTQQQSQHHFSSISLTRPSISPQTLNISNNFFPHSQSNSHLRSVSLCPPVSSISARSSVENLENPMHRIISKYVPQQQLQQPTNYHKTKTPPPVIKNILSDKENISPQINRRKNILGDKERVDLQNRFKQVQVISNRAGSAMYGGNNNPNSSKWDVMDSLEIENEAKESQGIMLGTIKDLHSKIMLSKKQ